jgi:hypothetical protein
MWKAHFTPVNYAVAYGFHEHENVVVFWVEDDFLEGCLSSIRFPL